MGGQSFAEEEAGILVGNHSNEAMKPEPSLRTNWPDLAWGEGGNEGSRGHWAQAEGEEPDGTPDVCSQETRPRWAEGAAIPLGCLLRHRREKSGATVTLLACPGGKLSSPSGTLSRAAGL